MPKRLTQKERKAFLDEKAAHYEHPRFITSDPIQVPHRFDKKEDIEIAAFLTSTIAWGNRKSIINNSNKMMELLWNAPYDFVINHTQNDLEPLQYFVHRTFNGSDLQYFITALHHIYTKHQGLEIVFTKPVQTHSTQAAIHHFKELFFSLPQHPPRSTKHVSDPMKNSAAKRLNMFLRWMVRSPEKGVDFGIWKRISPSQLSCPLDVHSGNVARKLGLLKRKQNDAKALAELDAALRKLDAEDPVKYDFALFGLGVFEKF